MPPATTDIPARAPATRRCPPRSSYRSIVVLPLAGAIVLLLSTASAPARAQCLLANPSFEVLGSGGQVFGGWNQFGVVGVAADAPHGSKAARASGPNTGTWDVSGFWQWFGSAPGERWEASVRVWHSATNPLVGGNLAILNIEWRNASGDLISYESHTVAGASTPLNEIQSVTVQSGPAPTGTAATVFLLGVLQSPTDPASDVYFDQASFQSLNSPTVDDIQWNDFHGGNTLSFAGRTWRVKGPGFYGPGPSLFCDAPNCAWVDVDGRLHLTVKKLSGSWYSTEVTLEDPLGYGDYIFTTRGRLDALHPNVVLGLFLWEYGVCYDPAYLWWNPFNEIDVEYSRWGDPANDVGQFVAQPYDWPGNLTRFDAAFDTDEITSHAFRWLPHRVEYRSWRGGPESEAVSAPISSWTYTGPHIPRPEQPRVHLNLWQFGGPPTSDQEVVFDDFTFVPACHTPPCVTGIGDEPPPVFVVSHLFPANPNPAVSRTVLRFTLPREGSARMAIYDVAGRLVRVLVDDVLPAGAHQTEWNARDDAGRRVSPGVYLYQLQAGGIVETRRLVLLHTGGER
jgi:hypothetical protein